MKKYLLMMVLVFMASAGNAVGTLYVDGKVTKIVSFPHSYGTYSESSRGLLGIYVEGLPPGCGDGTARVVIGVDHPLHASVLALALTAHSTGKTVRLAYFDACTIRSESWDFAYMVLNSQ